MKCPVCLHENPEAQKFCGECGARLIADGAAEKLLASQNLDRAALASQLAQEGEHKLVTVMFCDIANSTPLAARIGAEAMHSLLNHFFELALAEVQRYEGTINNFLGDGFMALFGAPLANEDHSRRALLAAIGIQQRLAAAGSDEQALRDIRVRIGVNTGMVVVGKIGNLGMDYTAIGDTVNLAARLQQQGEPGAVRISEATYRTAQHYFEFTALGKQAFKGIAEPIQVYELLKARSEANPLIDDSAISSALIGRESELAILSSSVASVLKGSGGIVVIQGEAGVGKSRLVAEARNLSRADGVLWLEGHGLSFGRNLSYWPFIEILKACFGINDSDGEKEAWKKLKEAMRALFDERAHEFVPYLATVLSLEMTEEYEQRVKFLDAQALRRQVFLSMHEFFDRLAQRQPIILLLQDWHWVDQSSLSLCEHLLPIASGHGVAFWFTTRADPGEPAARVRAAASRNPKVRNEEVALVPLGAEQGSALIGNLAGTLPETLRRQILDKTGGNPFFIEEVLRALIAEGTLIREPRAQTWRLAKPVTTLALPDTIQGVIVARIDRLDENVRSVLKLAAVIGRSFFLRILRTISESVEIVDGSVVQLEAAELIRLRQQSPELEYVFKHALVQEAAYGSILVERRRAIHRRVAEAVERLFVDRLDEFTSLLAYHYALAEDWEKAQHYLFKAGDQAGRMAADAEALEHYRQAEAAYARVAAQDLTPLQRAILDRKLGQAFYGVGNYDQAVEHCTRALAHLGVHYPKTRWGVRRSMVNFLAAHFLRRFMLGKGHASRHKMDLATAQEISMICQSLGWLDYLVDEERFGLDGLIELYAGERSGDVLGRARGLATLGILFMMLRAFPLARRYIDEAVTIARDSDHPAAIGPAVFMRGWIQWTSGALDESVQSFLQSAKVHESIGDIRRWGGPTYYLCWVLYQRADFASVVKLASELVRVGEGAGDPHVVSWGRGALGVLSLTVGPLDQAASRLSTVRDLCVQISAFRGQANVGGILGKCRLRQGRLREANAILQEAIGLIEARNLRGLWSAEPLNAFAELCLVNVGRLVGAPRRKALRTAHRACVKALRCTRDAVTWLPETLRLYGTLAWLSGDTKSARERWGRGLTTAQNLGLAVEQARTLLEMGNRLNEVSPVDEAIAVFEQTGASVDLAFGLHVRARMSLDQEEEPLATRLFYDRAISKLSEVKAEYELGLALGKRAEIHKLLGHMDASAQDFSRAQTCFDAVSATREAGEGRDQQQVKYA